MSGYTPGPWKWWTTHEGAHRINPKEGGLVIASCDTRNPFSAEQEANARLIAAAPDLLEIALRWAALDGGAWNITRYEHEKATLLDDTRAAIAKAEGK